MHTYFHFACMHVCKLCVCERKSGEEKERGEGEGRQRRARERRRRRREKGEESKGEEEEESVFCTPGWYGTLYEVEDGLKLLLLPPPTPECSDYKLQAWSTGLGCAGLKIILRTSHILGTHSNN